MARSKPISVKIATTKVIKALETRLAKLEADYTKQDEILSHWVQNGQQVSSSQPSALSHYKKQKQKQKQSKESQLSFSLDIGTEQIFHHDFDGGSVAHGALLHFAPALLTQHMATFWIEHHLGL